MRLRGLGSCAVIIVGACTGAQQVPAPSPALTAPQEEGGESQPQPSADAGPAHSAKPPPDELGQTDDEPAPTPDVRAVATSDAGAATGCRHGGTPVAMPAKPAVPKRIRSGPPITNHVPAELIMRAIRTRTACLRRCYEAGLVAQPDLGGRLAVRFVIDLDGWVRAVEEAPGSELRSPEVVACVIDEIRGLQYPQLEGGTVTVVYPFVFAPK